MNNRFKKILAIVALLMLPVAAFADLGLPSLFPTDAGDISIDFLTRIFGHVPGVLYGTNFQLVAELAKVFNTALVSVMGALFTYTTLKVTLHAAHEGEMMAGKGKSLGMAVLRSVGGLSLCIPAGSGYCAGQIIVLWLAVQGIGLGNMAWKGVVDYLTQGGAIYQKASSDMDDAPQLSVMAGDFSKVLQSEACVYKLESIYTTQKNKEMQTNSELSANGASDVATTSTSSYPAASGVFGFGLNRDGESYSFGTKNTSYNKDATGSSPLSQQNEYNAECGTLSVASLVAAAKTSNAAGTEKSLKPAVDSLKAAVNSVVEFMQPAAKQLAAYDSTKSDTTLVDYLGGTVATVSVNYANMITPARMAMGEAAMDAKRKTLDKSKKEGWMTAGSYYLLMGQLSAASRKPLSDFKPQIVANGFSESAFNHPNAATQGTSDYDVNSMSAAERKSLVETIHMGAQGNGKFYNEVIPSYTTYLKLFSEAGTTHNDYVTDAKKMNSGHLTHNIQSGVDTVSGIGFTGGPVAGTLMTVWAYKMKEMATGFRNAIAPDNLDPILKLQRFGVNLQSIAVSYFLGTFFAVFATVFASSLAVSMTLSTAAKASAELPNIVVTMWIGMCFILGGALGYYLVLVLFIVWFTSVISYIGHIFQSVFGVILLLLRLTDPEGEGIIGKAGEGLTMLFSLCLTPFLLVAGFIVSIVFTKEALTLLNFMFNTLMGTTLETWQVNSATWLMVGMPLVITIYTTIVISLVQLIATLCLTDGVNNIKGFFAAAAASQRVAGEMHQDTKGAASGQSTSHGQSTASAGKAGHSDSVSGSDAAEKIKNAGKKKPETPDVKGGGG